MKLLLVLASMGLFCYTFPEISYSSAIPGRLPSQQDLGLTWLQAVQYSMAHTNGWGQLKLYSIVNIGAWTTFFDKPTPYNVRLTGRYLNEFCNVCWLLVDETSTIHTTLVGNSSIQIDPSGKVIGVEGLDEPVAMWALTHEMNQRIHAIGHYVSTTSSILAHQILPVSHPLFSLITQILHPPSCVTNDVFGYTTAFLGTNTILTLAQPDTTSVYLLPAPHILATEKGQFISNFISENSAIPFLQDLRYV
jgi:hypothetical protein